MNSKCVLFLLSFISFAALASAYPQGDEPLDELMRSYKQGEDMEPGKETMISKLSSSSCRHNYVL